MTRPRAARSRVVIHQRRSGIAVPNAESALERTWFDVQRKHKFSRIAPDSHAASGDAHCGFWSSFRFQYHAALTHGPMNLYCPRHIVLICLARMAMRKEAIELH